MIYNKDKHYYYLSIIILVCFFSFPFLWILCVSLQPGDIIYEGKYHLIPDTVSFQAYYDAIFKNKNNIASSLKYTFLVCSISTVLSVLFALSAIYLVMADFIIENWKKRILTFSIGLYFLPVFLIYPGIKKLSSFLPYIAHLNTYNLIFSHTIFGFTNAFILLLLIYGLSKNTFFEQLLLENNNRMKSFFQGIVLIKPLGIFIIPGITFASIWSEFFFFFFITN